MAWMRQGWTYRIRNGNTRMRKHKKEYTERVEYEMALIKSKGFIDYFLLMSEAVRWAKDSGIPVGPSRGSAAASLVCYLLRITEIDPLQFPFMMFERFIAPDREDIPDIDLDFDDERRHEVRQHLVDKYGANRVGNIGTFTKYKGKNSIDDVARVYRETIPKWKAEIVKGMIVERSGGDSRSDQSLIDTIEMFPAAKAIMEECPDLYKAGRLQGNYRGMSTHAAGVVVTNTAVSDICALYTREVKGEEISALSVNKYDAEYLGIMKLDLLGLKTMGVIRYALADAGLSLEDLYSVPLDDPEAIGIFTRNDVVGIFQFEGRATRLVNRDVRPTRFMELSDINGLSRPGPLFSGTTAEYIRIKHGVAQATRFHPIIDEITGPTHGQVIYQEQVLQALSRFGGLSVGRVHEIRRIISQKLGEASFNTSQNDFVEQAMEMHGVTRKIAEDVWGRLVTSASYSFNVAHSISYSMLAYWCAYLKAHHPVPFYAAHLRKAQEEDWGRLIKDAERHGVKVRGVTPGKSQVNWSIAEDEEQEAQAIVAGWQQLRGIGQSTSERIVEYTDQHPVSSADDLLQVRGIGPSKVKQFREQIESPDPFGLLKTRHSIDSIKQGFRDRTFAERLPIPEHSSDDLLDIKGGKVIPWMGMVKLKEYKDAIEDERARSGRDLDEIRKTMKRPDLPTSCTLHCYDDGDEDVYVRINRFDYPKYKDVLQMIKEKHDVIYVLARKSNAGFGASLYVMTAKRNDPFKAGAKIEIPGLVLFDPDDD